MIRFTSRGIGLGVLLLTALSSVGCMSPMMGCNTGCDPCYDGGCNAGYARPCRWRPCFGCGGCGLFGGGLRGRLAPRSLAIPDQYPVGAVERASFHQMQTNAEAADFIFHLNDFVGETAELSPDGKDKILEIAARMRSAPFPVLVERSWNNSDPELDAHRRDLVVMVLAEKGNPDANNRTFVSPAYGMGKSSLEAAPEYYQFIYQNSGNNNNNNNNNNGGFGGGSGGGGGGFGGGGGGGGGGFGGGGFGI